MTRLRINAGQIAGIRITVGIAVRNIKEQNEVVAFFE
jgi:hypothetical protein